MGNFSIIVHLIHSYQNRVKLTDANKHQCAVSVWAIIFSKKDFPIKHLQFKIMMCVFVALLFISGCVVVPTNDVSSINKCEISTDRKTLKIINGFEETNTYYSISGLILIPITGVVSGTYVAINNIYRIGEEAVVCGKKT